MIDLKEMDFAIPVSTVYLNTPFNVCVPMLPPLHHIREHSDKYPPQDLLCTPYFILPHDNMAVLP